MNLNQVLNVRKITLNVNHRRKPTDWTPKSMSRESSVVDPDNPAKMRDQHHGHPFALARGPISLCRRGEGFFCSSPPGSFVPILSYIWVLSFIWKEFLSQFLYDTPRSNATKTKWNRGRVLRPHIGHTFYYLCQRGPFWSPFRVSS